MITTFRYRTIIICSPSENLEERLFYELEKQLLINDPREKFPKVTLFSNEKELNTAFEQNNTYEEVILPFHIDLLFINISHILIKPSFILILVVDNVEEFKKTPLYNSKIKNRLINPNKKRKKSLFKEMYNPRNITEITL